MSNVCEGDTDTRLHTFHPHLRPGVSTPHTFIHTCLLQILDDGRVTDSQGRTVRCVYGTSNRPVHTLSRPLTLSA